MRKAPLQIIAQFSAAAVSDEITARSALEHALNTRLKAQSNGLCTATQSSAEHIEIFCNVHRAKDGIVAIENACREIGVEEIAFAWRSTFYRNAEWEGIQGKPFPQFLSVVAE